MHSAVSFSKETLETFAAVYPTRTRHPFPSLTTFVAEYEKVNCIYAMLPTIELRSNDRTKPWLIQKNYVHSPPSHAIAIRKGTSQISLREHAYSNTQKPPSQTGKKKRIALLGPITHHDQSSMVSLCLNFRPARSAARKQNWLPYSSISM